MLNLFNVAFVFFAASFIAAIVLSSTIAAVLSIAIVTLFLINKIFERLYPVAKPEPTAAELKQMQIDFQIEVRAELQRIASMNTIKNVVGMR